MRDRQRRRTRLQCLVLGAEAAGKTSLLRRYFHDTYDGTRMPTIGSDFYSGRVSFSRDTGGSSSSKQKPQQEQHHEHEEVIDVNLQMWDTPGRARFSLQRQNRKYAAVLTPDFFRQADAIMLVYDMTSSTSFTQLLKWYADLMELRKGSSSSSTQKRTKNENPRRRPVPFFIVGNKLDLFQINAENGGPTHPSRRRRVEQRDVIGLKGNFRGKDFRYEYQVSLDDDHDHHDHTPTTRATPYSSSSSRKKSTRKNHEPPKVVVNRKRMEISSYYLANHDNWTSDFSYLESLLSSEDKSHPDREMVLLWCMRQGLKHYETSAATGEGVTDAVQALLQLALEEKEQQEQQRASHDVSSCLSPTRQEKLDLHQRYAVKENDCFFGMCPLIRGFWK